MLTPMLIIESEFAALLLWRLLVKIRAATGPCACGFGVEVPRGRKNSCDAVVAEFFADALTDRYRNAFHPKARSHGPITALAIEVWRRLSCR